MNNQMIFLKRRMEIKVQNLVKKSFKMALIPKKMSKIIQNNKYNKFKLNTRNYKIKLIK